MIDHDFKYDGRMRGHNTMNSTSEYDSWVDQQLEQGHDPRYLFPSPEQFLLRQRFARKRNLTTEHHDQIIGTFQASPVVLWEMGTDAK